MRGVGVEREAGRARRVDLGGADAGRRVRDLALEVGELDGVEVGEGQVPDAGGGEVHRHRRAESAEPDDEHARRGEPSLTLGADLREREVTGVTTVGRGVHAREHIARTIGAA